MRAGLDSAAAAAVLGHEDPNTTLRVRASARRYACSPSGASTVRLCEQFPEAAVDCAAETSLGRPTA